MMKRTFLITGASKGIGLALAHRLIGAGQHVVGIARGTSENFPGTLISADLADVQQTQRVFEELSLRYEFDGIVNNVGLVKPQRLGQVDLASFEEVMRVNLNPAIQGTQAILAGMKSRGWGRIINISSLTALGSVERTAYAAAKASLISFTRNWALELAQTGITVNAVAPGATETELFRANNPPGSVGEERYLRGVPMNRFGKPDEIAATIAFLMSEDAAFMTGQTLYVDGGASIGNLLF
ncbi:SDR family oxidoreductase [Raoultella ornithinolytica]|uniref:SDR family oxidoreductase n=1 Tax=Raoultella ornithinolytica TaxID=54291 RepID=UPI003D36CD09